VTDGLAISCENNRVASTISDGCQVTSVENETFPFVFGDEFVDWLVDFQLSVLLPFFLHREILMPWGVY